MDLQGNWRRRACRPEEHVLGALSQPSAYSEARLSLPLPCHSDPPKSECPAQSSLPTSDDVIVISMGQPGARFLPVFALGQITILRSNGEGGSCNLADRDKAQICYFLILIF